MNIHRLHSAKDIRSVTDHYPEHFTYDFETWIEEPLNFAYKSGDNLGFGEFKSPGVYHVHFCFHTARGRAAISLSKDLLRRLFKDTQFNSIVGLIHEDNKKARWTIRQVGLRSLGLIETKNGPCEMFYLTKKDFTDGF
jgi:hypothetical protein